MPKALGDHHLSINPDNLKMGASFISLDGGLQIRPRSGLTVNAQLQVRNFSSRKYKSHRRVGETVGQAFD